MFYAHFVLSKKGPLARIWLAAHWDKKLTKAHVFETNIDSSVEAIMQPKVKLALRTSGHLLLGVVRIYSRKAKYLLADCNEAFVKIKMAFRPGVVDLPEENREAAITAITLQENFHDFDTTLADLNDLDVQAQFSVNQSRPEEITMREDLASIAFVGDDGFGDVDVGGFDEREILRDATNLEDSLYKQPDISNHQPVEEKEKTLNENATEKPIDMDVDLEAPVTDDGFGGAVDGGFMDADDDDDDDNDDGGFGGGVDQEFFGDDFMNSGGLFEDAPMADVTMPAPVEVEGPVPEKAPEPVGPESIQPTEAEPVAPQQTTVVATEQTTLINNEEEAFALPPLDATIVQGVSEKKGKRKRKLIVDEQKGIPSETMKLQLSDTSDVISTLDLAPPTKKLMHWKETGGVEKLFSLPGRTISSRAASKLFGRNLITRQVKEEEHEDEEKIVLESPEIVREEDKTVHNKTKPRVEDISTILEEPSILEVSNASARSRRSEKPRTPAPVPEPEKSTVEEPANTTDIFSNTFTEAVVDMPADPLALNAQLDPYDQDPPSIAPFSVPPPSVPPPSVGPPPSEPPPIAPSFSIEGDLETEAMPENEEQEELRWTKRTQKMQHSLDIGFRYKNPLGFKEMSRNLNRKQAAARFYTLLVLKKYQAVEVDQPEEFGDIYIRKGPQFGIAC
ncbi:double-strand-break repair protein rad21 homolog isoform X3 [Mizuhopecten yessoensis]|uniref:double-strand-break repair protein rad21 homolog isoform X3 n=1 Tax=Mizuhopecten yessoensis TaxID=6573 RepID=UPI000B45E2A2|nr:double-strand-break repair protein rad21 homolog isoform X3 [Mizuhopecten yessoensis]